MRAAHDFDKGYQARTQKFYPALAVDLHVHETPDITGRVKELMGRHAVFPYLTGTHVHCAFGQLDGHGSGHYTYMWSLVIARDLFSRFEPQDLFDPQVAAAYRDKVLAPGGSRAASGPGCRLLGRPNTFDAYAAWLAEPVAVKDPR